jgi:hypothetical protein
VSKPGPELDRGRSAPADLSTAARDPRGLTVNVGRAALITLGLRGGTVSLVGEQRYVGDYGKPAELGGRTDGARRRIT